MPSVHSTQQHSNSNLASSLLTKPIQSANVTLSQSQGRSQTAQQQGCSPCQVGDPADVTQAVLDGLHDAQELFYAAERIIKESCGEKWLLQPFIPDMEKNEYRYLC